MSERKANSKIYDSVFTDLFKDPEYQLQLYKALHPEEKDVTTDDITNVTIEAIMLNQLYNDLGFTVGNRSIFLIEAQSTWCSNMALRALLYLAETFNSYVKSTNQNYYASRPVRIPKPELYVLYTGDGEHSEDTISLAKEHWSGDDSFMDLRVKVLYGDEDGTILSQYVAFTRIYKKHRAQLGETEEAVVSAIEECIASGVLKDYLETKKTEVVNIMMSLFDAKQNQEMFANSERNEGREEGREEGRKEERMNIIRRLLGKMTVGEIVELGYTTDEIELAAK